LTVNPDFNGTPLFDISISEMIQVRAIVTVNASRNLYALYRMVQFLMILSVS